MVYDKSAYAISAKVCKCDSMLTILINTMDNYNNNHSKIVFNQAQDTVFKSSDKYNPKYLHS